MESNVPKLEERILKRWKEIRAFERSVERRKGSERFVFYEGPPTANAGPGIHHVLSRAFKDVVLRYKTQRGFYVPRKAGWDTHGLPVELQIEKKLGLVSKKDIEDYGIAKFNEACRKSVWEFQQDWENLTERVGFWVDMDDPYVTYQVSYMETLWRIISLWWEKGYLYQDYKVVPYCARCGTALSSHEVAQGYKTVREPAITVKFKMTTDSVERFFSKKGLDGSNNIYMLAWTTTPWTIPGNVALAVNPELKYALVQKGDDHLIVANDLVSTILPDEKVVATMKGSTLVGIEYDPVFRFGDPEPGKVAWKVVPADFVTAQDGTGVVHTAVAYGVEDHELGKKENLTMLHLVKQDGTFSDKVDPWKGQFVKEADPLIIKELDRIGALFSSQQHDHEYPHCWRCSTPLLYYAKESWFVNMQKCKRDLVSNNKKVNWVPAYIKEGRMGEWLSEVKDWAFSRERYWGTPLPLWTCSSCGHVDAVGSLKEMANRTRSSNDYYLLRHGDSDKQKKNIISSYPEKTKVSLTDKGKKEVKRAASELKGKGIDVIISSDLRRAKETAEIVAQEIGAEILYDKRMREFDAGSYNGSPIEEYAKHFRVEGESEMEHYLNRFKRRAPGGENWKDVQKRSHSLLKELERKHQGKGVLMVGHESPLTLMEGVMRGMTKEQVINHRKRSAITTGEWRKVQCSRFPYNRSMEIDLHRPYVDEITFPCSECKDGTMRRVIDVADVWFDSGAMPFAQEHWPFEKGHSDSVPPTHFPADYITEAIDQTRGWFYTLLAISALLGFGPTYKNAVSLGHLLDAKGEKMSKSKGNVVDPWSMLDKYGADTLRWYLYSVNHPGDSKLFSEKDLQLTQRKFVRTLQNSLLFLQTYRKKVKPSASSSHVLDRWILSRLQSVTKEVTEEMDAYNITDATRILEDFIIQDCSLWYIRRSRGRFQNPRTAQEAKDATATLEYVLDRTSRLIAPFAPFLAEAVYGEIQGKRMKSVHWEDWPEFDGSLQDVGLEKSMRLARDVVGMALAKRQESGLKVRQPLAELKVPKMPSEMLPLIQEEVNVKKVTIGREVELDTKITPALKREGMVRELLRHLQDMRKKAGYKPQDDVYVRFEAEKVMSQLFSDHENDIKEVAGVASLNEGPKRKEVFDIEKQITIEGHEAWIGMRK